MKMTNPAGNYPGRQIFLGGLQAGHPAFVYLVSGRSKGSQERIADPYDERECAIRISPVDPKEKFDPFRHYQAVKIWPSNGILVVSNNQATVDPVLEGYALMTDKERTSATLLRDVLHAVGPEYDNKDRNKCTPRITGVVYPAVKTWKQALGITTKRGNIRASFVPPEEVLVRHLDVQYLGRFDYVPTYNGEVDYSKFDVQRLLAGGTVFAFKADT